MRAVARAWLGRGCVVLGSPLPVLPLSASCSRTAFLLPSRVRRRAFHAAPALLLLRPSPVARAEPTPEGVEGTTTEAAADATAAAAAASAPDAANAAPPAATPERAAQLYQQALALREADDLLRSEAAFAVAVDVAREAGAGETCALALAGRAHALLLSKRITESLDVWQEYAKQQSSLDVAIAAQYDLYHAESASAAGNHAEAAQLALGAADAFASAYGAGTTYEAMARCNHSLYMAMQPDKEAEAVQAALVALQGMEKTIGRDNKYTIAHARNCMTLLVRVGRHDEAKDMVARWEEEVPVEVDVSDVEHHEHAEALEQSLQEHGHLKSFEPHGVRRPSTGMTAQFGQFLRAWKESNLPLEASLAEPLHKVVKE